MKKNNLNIFSFYIFSACFFVAVFFIFNFVKAESFDVNMTVPTSSSVCGDGVIEGDEQCDDGASNNGPCPKNCSSSCTTNTCIDPPPPDEYPVISDVITTTTINTAEIKWTATDDKSISSCGFNYGENYGLSASPSNSGSLFTVNLTGLSDNTSYNFRITCTDSASKSTDSEGSFTTKEIVVIDDTPPVIITYEVIVGTTTAEIIWTTDELSDGQVNYGLTSLYGSNLIDENYTTEHSLILGSESSPLLPNTLYNFKIISTDQSGNSASTINDNFTTLKDLISPPAPSSFNVISATSSFSLSWINPSLDTHPDFLGVKVLRKTDSASSNHNDGTLVYEGNGQNFTDVNISLGTEYYYTIFSYDTSLNYSSGAYDTGFIEIIPNTEQNCSDNIDNDNDGQTDCQDSDCSGVVGCTECSDNIDNDNDGLIDLNDPGCENQNDDNEKHEICNNGKDDDEDGQTDCQDSDCFGVVGCTECSDNIDNDNDGLIDLNDPGCEGDSLDDSEFHIVVDDPYCGDGITNNLEECDQGNKNGPCPSSCSLSCTKNNCVVIDEDDDGGGGTGEEIPVCNDGQDNDGDGLVDLNDPGCEDENDNEEYNSEEPSGEIFDISDLNFYIANKNIKAELIENTISLLVSNLLNIEVVINDTEEINELVLKLNNSNYLFEFDGEKYNTSVSLPKVGVYDAYVEATNSNNLKDFVYFKINSLSYGTVVDSNSNNRLENVKITLLDENKEKINLTLYNQANPIFSNNSGLYGWVIPNGNYYLKVEKINYYTRETQLFNVKNNTVNRNLELVLKPKKIIEVIDPNAGVAENVLNVAKNLGEKARATTQRVTQAITETVDNPKVEEISSKAVAPTAVGVATASTLPVIWFNFINFFKFLFLQPLLLLGRARRKKWGQVYNSLDKLPVDLATVRLIDAYSGKVIQSQVTDSKGRFLFGNVNKGVYKLEVQKHDFEFPSSLLKDRKVDGNKTDLYTGEQIVVDEDGSFLTPNIPLDPVEKEVKPPFKIRVEAFFRKLRVFLSWLGLLVTALALYISPEWYVWVLFVFHVIVFLIFRRLSISKKPKGWGVVYDKTSQTPIGRAVARLFDSEFNRLVSTQITDGKGRYSFLAGNNKYYVTYEHKGYKPEKIKDINLEGKEEDLVAVDVALEKGNLQNRENIKVSTEQTLENKEDEPKYKVKAEDNFNGVEKKGVEAQIQNESEINKEDID